MNILFITHPHPNYIPDLLLHGLRKLLGHQVTDYPKKDCLYNQTNDNFWPELYRDTSWFPKDNGEIDREDILPKLYNGFFEYLVCDLRAYKILNAIKEKFRMVKAKIVIIDGEDFPRNIQPGNHVICRRETDGSDFSIPLQMSIPEEIYHRIAAFDENPKLYSIGFMGSIGSLNEIRGRVIDKLSTWYPNCLFKTSTSLVDGPERLGERFGLDKYYSALQNCKIALNFRGAGYDTFRYWENASCNAVHISEKMPLFIPNDFTDKQHILRFTEVDELRRIIDFILENKENADRLIQNSKSHLLKYHLTTKRASYFLEKIDKAFAL